jgi:hypothetical protein
LRRAAHGAAAERMIVAAFAIYRAVNRRRP